MHRVCMVCHSKNNGFQEMNILHRIQKIVSTSNPSDKSIRMAKQRMMFHVNFQCKYGLPCAELSQKEQQINQLGAKIAPYVIEYCKNKENNIQEVYNMCRGTFPQACRTIVWFYNN